MMKIDIHTHILPENWPDLREKYGYGGWVRLEHEHPGCARMMVDDQFFREVQANLWDPERRLASAQSVRILGDRVGAPRSGDRP